MRIYDPLGIVSNVVIGGHLVLRDAWKAGCGWDEEVPLDIASRWKDWAEAVSYLIPIEIPRRSGITEETRELHIFTDASDKAMAAVSTSVDKETTESHPKS